MRRDQAIVSRLEFVTEVLHIPGFSAEVNDRPQELLAQKKPTFVQQERFHKNTCGFPYRLFRLSSLSFSLSLLALTFFLGGGIID